MKNRLILFVLFLFAFSACKEDEAQNMDGVHYRVSLQLDWSAETYSGVFPEGAAISPFVAFSHAGFVELFSENEIASPGLKALAEQGHISPLDNEIQDIIDAQNGFDLVTSSRLEAPGTVLADLQTEVGNEHVTLVAQISPSPDWFVGVRNVNLYKGGEWIEYVSVPLVAYDAGTDNGKSFLSPNETLDVPFSVRAIVEPPLASLSGETLTPLGYVRFERILK